MSLINHRYHDPLSQFAEAQYLPKDGMPAVAELWRLAALHRKSVIYLSCLMFIVCFIWKASEINNSNSGSEMLLESRSQPADICPPPSSQDHFIPPHLVDSNATRMIDFSVGDCNIFRGEWIAHPDGPAYTNASCPFIWDNQNCIKNGRPDRGFLYWRWKPYNCELPLFDATAFMKIVAGKKLAIIGDSLARNHFLSALCLLAQVEMPDCRYNEGHDGNIDCFFKSYNFTLAMRWAPFLVRFTEDEADGFAQGILKVYVDEVFESWAPFLHTFNYTVFSTGHWYTRPSLYLAQHKPIGCHYLPTLNVTEVGIGSGLREALQTVFNFLISSQYKGMVFFRTIAPSHWENAPWNQGGNCSHKAPSRRNSVALDDLVLDLYKAQLEEFANLEQRSSEFSFKLKIMDVTESALQRPDAHPGSYGYFHPHVQNDCLHWCLPGAVDAWSDMLLDVLSHLS